MMDDNDLGSVPDASMLALFKSLVTFLSSEAEVRGWSDIKTRLQSVESALSGLQEEVSVDD